jgi:hypothetical protein
MLGVVDLHPLAALNGSERAGLPAIGREPVHHRCSASPMLVMVNNAVSIPRFQIGPR